MSEHASAMEPVPKVLDLASARPTVDRLPPDTRAVPLKVAARMCGVCTKTMRHEIDRGNLRALQIGGKWVIRLKELDAYLERQERKFSTDVKAG